MIILCLSSYGYAKSDEIVNNKKQIEPHRYQLVENFTAYTLKENEYQLGLMLNYGVSDNLDFGVNTLLTIFAVPNLNFKYKFHEDSSHTLSFGLSGVWIDMNKMPQFSILNDKLETLSYKALYPSLSWTKKISPRLNIHTYWSFSIEDMNFKLKEDYEVKTKADETDNEVTKQDETKAPDYIDRDAIELQALLGTSGNSFQITGEYSRTDKNKILFTTILTKSSINKLNGKSIGLSVSHQWIMEHLQFRVGLGLHYLNITGQDLAGEVVDINKTQQKPEIQIYWRL